MSAVPEATVLLLLLTWFAGIDLTLLLVSCFVCYLPSFVRVWCGAVGGYVLFQDKDKAYNDNDADPSSAAAAAPAAAAAAGAGEALDIGDGFDIGGGIGDGEPDSLAVRGGQRTGRIGDGEPGRG